MSKPPFSRKRKGKTVDPYPLRDKGPSKSSSTKRGGKGRPRKPMTHQEQTVKKIRETRLMYEKHIIDEGFKSNSDRILKRIEEIVEKGITPIDAELASMVIGRIQENFYWNVLEAGGYDHEISEEINEGLLEAEDLLDQVAKEEVVQIKGSPPSRVPLKSSELGIKGLSESELEHLSKEVYRLEKEAIGLPYLEPKDFKILFEETPNEIPLPGEEWTDWSLYSVQEKYYLTYCEANPEYDFTKRFDRLEDVKTYLRGQWL